MTSPIFGHVVTAMVTPFTINGKVDIVVAMQLAEHLLTHGSDSLIVCGTTGESPTLTCLERQELFKAIRRIVGGSAKLLLGTGTNSTVESVESTKSAYQMGADGALVVTPYYNRPPQEGLQAHFEAIANESPELPLMLYNIPSRTGCNLAPETVGRLMNLPNIVSFKAASNSIEEVSQLRQVCGQKLAIYSGDDGLTLPMLIVGSVGVVSVGSHLVGRQIGTMIEAFLSGNNTVALTLHEELLPLFKSLFTLTNPIPIKSALALSGWHVGDPRLPLVPMNKDMRKSLVSTLETLASA